VEVQAPDQCPYLNSLMYQIIRPATLYSYAASNISSKHQIIHIYIHNSHFNLLYALTIFHNKLSLIIYCDRSMGSRRRVQGYP